MRKKNIWKSKLYPTPLKFHRRSEDQNAAKKDKAEDSGDVRRGSTLLLGYGNQRQVPAPQGSGPGLGQPGRHLLRPLLDPQGNPELTGPGRPDCPLPRRRPDPHRIPPPGPRRHAPGPQEPLAQEAGSDHRHRHCHQRQGFQRERNMTENIIHDIASFASNQLWWQLCLILLAAVPLFTIVAVWRRPEILRTIIMRWDRSQAEKKVENCPHSWTVKGVAAQDKCPAKCSA